MAVLGMEDADFLLSRGLSRQDQYDRNAATVDPAPVPTMPPGLMDQANFAPAPAPAPVMPPGLVDQANFAPAPAPVVPVTDVAPPVVDAPAPVMPTGFELSVAGLAQAGAAAQTQAVEDIAAINSAQQKQKIIDEDETRIAKVAGLQTAADNARASQAKAAKQLADMKIDPAQYWEKKSTGGKIGVGIAMLLGAFGSGSENKAATIIRQAIDQDVDVQKANYQAKKGEVDVYGSVYSTMMSALKDEAQAKAATTAVLYEQVGLELQKNAAKAKGTAGSAAAMAGMGALQAARDTELAKLSAGAAAGYDEETKGFTAERLEKWIPKSNVPGLPYGEAFYAQKPEVIKLRTDIVNVANAVDAIGQLKNMTGVWLGSLSPARAAEAETLQQVLIGKLREAVFGPGILIDAERAIAMRLLPDPTKTFSLDARTLASLNMLQKIITDAVNRSGSSVGLKIDTPPKRIEREKGAAK